MNGNGKWLEWYFFFEEGSLFQVFVVDYTKCRSLYEKTSFLVVVHSVILLIKETMEKSILIVEDESVVALYFKELLRKFGYPVPVIAASYDEALSACRKKPPTLILMDINLKSEIDGIEAAQLLRNRFDFALVFLSAYGDKTMLSRTEPLKPHGYLVKPVNDSTVLATIQTVLRRYTDEQSGLSSSREDKILLRDNLYYIPHRAVIKHGEDSTSLSAQESCFLNMLCKNRGHIVHTRAIEEYVWPMEYVSDGAVAALVYRLRKKLPEDDIVRTVIGIGYCLD